MLFRSKLSEDDIQSAIERRASARKDKDFAAADGVREELLQQGIALQDAPRGTTWSPSPRLDVAADQTTS